MFIVRSPAAPSVLAMPRPLPLTVLSGLLVLATATPAAARHAPGVATLPAIGLARVEPGLVGADRQIRLGGIGSGLYPADRAGEYWTVTDRGPNGQIKVDGTNRRTFPVPDFDPAIIRVRARGDRLDVLQVIPIRGRSGAPVTGLSNQSRDEQPYTFDARTPLALNPDGLDPEGIVRTRDGGFWLVEEYSPSLVHVSATGRVLARYVPRGLSLTGTDYPVIEALPSILLFRKQNRGFEGIALAPDGRTVYLAVQSPLLVPTKKAGEASRNARIIRVDLATRRVTGEYAYRFEDVTTFDPAAGGDPSQLKISELTALDRHRLLVDERTDNVARIYVVDLRRATNLLGGRYDDPATAPSLEQLTDPATEGVTVLPKRLALDLATIPGVPGKIEGVALLGGHRVAIANDNDFGMTDGPAAFDPAGNLIDSGVPTRLWTLRLG